MFRNTYEEMVEKFTNGRNTRPPAPPKGSIPSWQYHTYWVERDHYDIVSIPDLLTLYHKRSKSTGILTKIGAETIGIRNAITGNEVSDSYKGFCFLDDQGGPILSEVVLDRFDVPIIAGQSFVAFAHGSDLHIGRVEKFTAIGTVMILKQPKTGKYEAGYKAFGGDQCIVLDEALPKVALIKAAFDR